MDLILKNALEKLNKYKFFTQAMANKEICLTDYPGFFSATVGNKILISRKTFDRYKNQNYYLPKDFVEQCVLYFLVVESMKIVMKSYERMDAQIKDSKTAQYARAAIYLEASWCANRVNKELNIYNKDTVESLKSCYGKFVLHPEDIRFKSGKSAEYYFELLMAWLRNVLRNQVDDMIIIPSQMSSGMNVTPMEADLSIFGIDPDSVTLVSDPIGGGGRSDIDTNHSSGVYLGDIINNIEADMAIDLEFNDAPLVDAGADQTQSQSFGYEDGATDYSYQNIDRRYSTDDAMIAGTVGAFNKVAFIFDVSGSMNFYDYSKLAVGLKAVINEYNSLDLFAATTRVKEYIFDVDANNMNEAMRRLPLGGSTDMLKVSKDVIKIGRENNKRYTHIFIFTDGETSYEDLTAFQEGNVFLYITDPRVQPPVGINFKYI
jgi:hypothetical protein